MNGVYVRNVTDTWNREVFMYALGDIRFKKPKSLRRMAYLLFFLLAWSLPIVIIFGLKFSLLPFAITFGVPFLLANFASRPVWGGKSLIDFTKSLFGFLSEPKGWTDLHNNNYNDNNYYTEHEIWISRRRELQLLTKIELNDRKGVKIG